MAATHSHEHDDFLGNDLPPPAYELTNSELDRKIADATQRSLSLQQEQLQRPNLPPLDEDGFPVWSEELFKYNEAQRQREDESRSTKLQSEYTRVETNASGSSGSTSTSPPVQPVPISGGSKQKENKWWFGPEVKEIAQDEHEGFNMGRPRSVSPQTQNVGRPPIQVQVGPRPHDVLAQPQSPTSDVDEDDVLAAGTPALGRAPTYYPVGQIHPGHTQRLERHSTQGSTSSIQTTLPAFTPEPESLEGPAYEEVVPVSSSRLQRQSAEWRPLNARPQVQERVSRASVVPHASVSPPPRPTAIVSAPPAPPHAHPSVPVHRPTAPSTYTPPVSLTPSARPAISSYMPSGYNPPVSVPRPSNFDPSSAYRPAQTQTQTQTHRYTLAGRVGGDEGILEAQRVLREGGASAFYNNAVAGTMLKAPAFQAPAPPPPRFTTDDGASVFSGRSAGRQSVGSGNARMSVYAPNDPTPDRISYIPPTTGQSYQPMGVQAYQPPMAGPAPGMFAPPLGAYQPNFGESRPLPNAPGFAQQQQFVAPPPPPGVSVQLGKKMGKLYKRL
ncbi:unnamed protein product [Rhizoctonia solani]|uniref:Uncharacterized protein n=1 Tax=Rhizoctonia solani TaxID=456999 RepID=A0A8H2WSA3_9AGAM|nr:unnamed protein product [Rhizoctonia solani]